MEAETTDSSESYYKMLAWLDANKTKLAVGLGAVLVIGVIAAIVAWQKTEAQTSANDALFQIPLDYATGNRVNAEHPTPLLNLAKQYPDTSGGEYAQVLGAEALFVEGKYADSDREFSKFIEDHPGSDLVAQAKVGVAASLEAEGKISDAVQKYKEIISSYLTDASIVSPAKLTLARLEEAQNRPDQALVYYDELAQINNPYDPWASEAQERREILLAKHPELRKKVPASEVNPSPATVEGLNLSSPAQTTPAPQNPGASKLLTIPSPSAPAPTGKH